MVELFKTKALNMKKSIILASMLIFLFPACEKETVQTLIATATLDGENATKTSYSDNGTDSQSALKVSWGDSETFNAYYSSSEYVTFCKSNGNTFTADNVPDGVTSETQFFGVYGEKAAYIDGTLTIDFCGQDGSLDNLGKYDIMTCTSTTENGVLKFAFKHNCAILRVKLVSSYTSSSDKTHLYMVFDNAKIKGTNNDSNITVSSNSSTDGINVTGSKVTFQMDFTDPITGNSLAPVTKTIYIAVPPMEWNNLSSPTILSANNRYQKVVELNSSVSSIAAGQLYDVTAEYASKVWEGDPD